MRAAPVFQLPGLFEGQLIVEIALHELVVFDEFLDRSRRVRPVLSGEMVRAFMAKAFLEPHFAGLLPRNM